MEGKKITKVSRLQVLGKEKAGWVKIGRPNGSWIT
jgi:hypothetical protein